MFNNFFGDVGDSAQEWDFRPWMHRMMELYSEVPKEKWHDPRIYSNSVSRTELERVVDTAISALFTGDEHARLRAQVEQARLKVGNQWASIPRLNLGLTEMPVPGQHDVRKDEFVTHAAPYLVEYLSSLGVMPAQEAEALISRRLTNYFVHRTGYQVSAGNARRIVDEIKAKSSNNLEESAA